VLARKPLPEGSVTAQVRLGLALLAYVPVRSGSLTQARISEFHLDPVIGQPPTWKIPAAHIKGADVDQVLPLPETAVVIVQELVHLAKAVRSPFLLPSPADPKQPIAEKTLTQTFRRMERTGRIGPVVEDGEEHLTLHSLRASWRSWALELGVPLDIAELAMGHVGGLQRAGYSEAAGRYTRSRALTRQAAALNRVGRHLDTFWKPSGPGAKVTQLPVRAKA